jgi:hypothetical protein
MLRTCAALVSALALAAPVGAVIIDSADGTANTSAPADDPGWANVGRIGFLTGVYLQDGWMLTANHVYTPNFVYLNGDPTQYNTIAGSEVRLRNPEPNGGLVDLKLVRINATPDLPPVTLSTAPASIGEDVVMIGYGRNRGSAWDYFCPPNFPNGDRDGWIWGTSQAMRWGTNEVRLANQVEGVGPPVGNTKIHFFTLRFDRSLPTTHEAIAANGDSGGVVFVKRSGTWELLGIMYAASQLQVGSDVVGPLAKPGSTCSGSTVDWNEMGTRAAEVFTYSGQIQEVLSPGVPSASVPGRALLAALIAVAGGAVVRSWRAAAAAK